MILDQNLKGESPVHLLKVLSKYRVPMLDYVSGHVQLKQDICHNSCVIT